MGKMVQIDPTEPFNYNRLYGDEKYSLNNMELKSVNFPDEVEEGHITSTWSDRMQTWSEEFRKGWEDACNLVQSRYNADAFFAGATDASFLAFAKAVGKVIGFQHEVTGARIVRYSNAGGYPTLLLILTNGGKKKPRRYSRRFGGGRMHDEEWGRVMFGEPFDM